MAFPESGAVFSRQKINFANRQNDRVLVFRFAPNSANFLLSCSWDATLRLYDVSANTLRVKFPCPSPLLDCTFQVRNRNSGRTPFPGFENPFLNKIISVFRTLSTSGPAVWTRLCERRTSTARQRRSSETTTTLSGQTQFAIQYSQKL